MISTPGAKARALDALRGYFTRQRRRLSLAQELPIYYPSEPHFAPDLLAVLAVRGRAAPARCGRGLGGMT